MCMKKRIATTSMVIVLLVCCVGVSNTKADDNNEYGILSNMGFSHSERNGFENLKNGNVSLSFSKNRDGKITSMSRKKARSASSYDTYIDYDERGRIIHVVAPDQTIEYSYDGDDISSISLNGIEIQAGMEDNIEDKNGRTVFFSNGTRLFKGGDEDGYLILGDALTGSVEVNGDLMPLRIGDGLRTTDYAYDDNGNLSGKRSPDGTISVGDGHVSMDMFDVSTNEEMGEGKITLTGRNGSAVLTKDGGDGVFSTYMGDKKLSFLDESGRDKGETTYSSVFGKSSNTYNDEQKVSCIDLGDIAMYYDYNEYGWIEDVEMGGASVEHYEYDESGDIVSFFDGEDTHCLEYGNPSDPRQLTSFDDKALEYDGYGNLISFDGFGFSWSDGSMLTSVTQGDKEYDYFYSPDGTRTRKTIGDEIVDYAYFDGRLVSSSSSLHGSINYVYDDSWNLIGLDHDGSIYFYLHDPLGRIEGIVDGDGDIQVQYSYDTWGNPEMVQCRNENLADANKVIYKDYVYDRETGLYYLDSRYYSPNLMRFISRDDLERISLQGYGDPTFNLYSYCQNDPLNMSDPCGYEALAATIGTIIAAVGVLFCAALLVQGILNNLRRNDSFGYSVINNSKWDLYEWIKKVLKTVGESILVFTISSWMWWKRYEPRKTERHHIIAQKHWKAEKARYYWLNKCGHKIDDNPNPIYLKYEFHKHIHTYAYFDCVNACISGSYKRNKVSGCEFALATMNAILVKINANLPF